MRFCLACQVVVSGNLNGESDGALTKRNALWDVACSVRRCIQHRLWNGEEVQDILELGENYLPCSVRSCARSQRMFD